MFINHVIIIYRNADSRNYGAVPVGLIQGRIVCKVNIPYGFFLPDLKVFEWVVHEYPHVGEKKKNPVIKIDVKKEAKVGVPVNVSAPESQSREGRNVLQQSQQLQQDDKRHLEENRQQLSQLKQLQQQIQQLEHRQISHRQAQQLNPGNQEVVNERKVAGAAVSTGKDDGTGALAVEYSTDSVSDDSDNNSGRVVVNELSDGSGGNENRNDR